MRSAFWSSLTRAQKSSKVEAFAFGTLAIVFSSRGQAEGGRPRSVARPRQELRQSVQRVRQRVLPQPLGAEPEAGEGLAEKDPSLGSDLAVLPPRREPEQDDLLLHRVHD